MNIFIVIWLALLTIWTIVKWRRNVDLWKTHYREEHPGILENNNATR